MIGELLFLYALIAFLTFIVIIFTDSGDEYDMSEIFAFAVFWPVTIIISLIRFIIHSFKSFRKL